MDSHQRAPKRRSASGRQTAVFLGVGVLAAVVDQATKSWALRHLSDPTEAPGGSFLTFDLIRNSGAAFSLGAGSTWIFSLLAAVIVAALSWWVLAGKTQSAVLSAIVGLIAGGAAGNLIDRLLRPPGFGQGHVIDFINYNDWFIGNVADIWIVGGTVALVGYVFFSDRGQTKTGEVSVPAPRLEGADG